MTATGAASVGGASPAWIDPGEGRPSRPAASFPRSFTPSFFVLSTEPSSHLITDGRLAPACARRNPSGQDRQNLA